MEGLVADEVAKLLGKVIFPKSSVNFVFIIFKRTFLNCSPNKFLVIETNQIPSEI